MPSALTPRLLWDLLFFAGGHRGPPSDHFDGRRFFNEGTAQAHGLRDLLRWRRERRAKPPPPWPRLEGPGPAPPPLARVGDAGLRATLVNHSTVLIQTAGVNLLTDPIWSDRAGPTARAGSPRRRPPGIRFEDLPRIDAVLVSHNHYDHMDLPTLRALSARDRPAIFTGLGNRAYLEARGVGPAIELDWWQEAQLPGGLGLVSLPARHFSARGIRDRNRTLWCGFAVKGPGVSVCYAGDTGAGSHLEQIGRRLGPFRLGLLPIGAFLPRWFMAPVHMAPEEAVRAHRQLRARTSLAIHFGTFPLADDGPGQAEAELRSEASAAGIGEREFRVPSFGFPEDIP